MSCEQPTVYYDGSCPLCSTEISFYRKREGAQAITFVDVSDAEQRTNLGDLDSEQAMRRFHVRDANGTINLFDRFYAIRGSVVEAVWDIPAPGDRT